MLLISTYNIYFHEALTKIIFSILLPSGAVFLDIVFCKKKKEKSFMGKTLFLFSFFFLYFFKSLLIISQPSGFCNKWLYKGLVKKHLKLT